MTEPLIDTWAPETVPVVRLRSPGDLAAAVPVLLGFRPHESLVLVALGGDRLRVGLVQRLDLVDACAHADTVPALVRNAVASGADAVVAVLVTDEPTDVVFASGPLHEVADDLGDTCAAAGLALLDVLAVCAGRWVSFLCRDPRCCPPEGTPVAPVGSTELEAAAVSAGHVVAPDRTAVTSRVAPVWEPGLLAVRQALERVVAGPEPLPDGPAALAIVERVLGACSAGAGAGPLDADTVARLLLAVAEAPVRDCLVGACLGPDAEGAQRLWLELTRRAPEDLVPAPATLLALSAYVEGDGLLARAALDRVLAAEPSYALARYTEALLQVAAPPTALREALARAAEESRARLG